MADLVLVPQRNKRYFTVFTFSFWSSEHWDYVLSSKPVAVAKNAEDSYTSKNVGSGFEVHIRA